MIRSSRSQAPSRSDLHRAAEFHARAEGWQVVTAESGAPDLAAGGRGSRLLELTDRRAVVGWSAE